MTPMRKAKKASSFLTPKKLINIKVKLSMMVIRAPAYNEMLNNILRAIAVPIISWISEPIIAISVISHKTTLTFVEN